jgi:Zinc finger, C2H2 type/C2H2-type zinc finger
MMEIVSAEALEPILKVENRNISKKKKKRRSITTKPSKGNRPICDLCGKTFVNMKGIRRHMKLELKYRLVPKVNPNIGKSVGRKIFCTQKDCGKNFNKRKNLENHMKMHEDSKVSCFKDTIEYLLNRTSDIP